MKSRGTATPSPIDEGLGRLVPAPEEPAEPAVPLLAEELAAVLASMATLAPPAPDVVFAATPDRDLGGLLRARLREEGLRGHVFGSVSDCLRRWRQHQPRLLLLDMAIRTPDALAFCRAVRAQEPLRTLPLVVMSRDGSLEARRLIFQAGADDWLALPWTLAEFHQRISGRLRSLPPPREVPGREATGPPRVVVADPDNMVRSLVAWHLQRLGWEVTGVEDGASALGACDRQRVDLLVVDLLAPLVGGLELVHALRDRTDRPRVVVMAAQDHDHNLVRALGSGADEFLGKPLNPAVMTARLRRLLAEA